MDQKKVVYMKKYLKKRDKAIKELVYAQLQYDPQYREYLRRIKIKRLCIRSNIVILMVIILILWFM